MPTAQTTPHDGLNSVTRLTTMTVGAFVDEVCFALYEERWMLLFLVLLIVCDFRYGWGECHKRQTKARDEGNALLVEQYRWHTSRAIRRTCNKFMDYVALMMLCTAAGKWLLPPMGVDYIFGAYAGCLVALFCEAKSIFGHFLYLRGISVQEATVSGFVKHLAVALAKRKSKDFGEALEETLGEKDNGNTDTNEKE